MTFKDWRNEARAQAPTAHVITTIAPGVAVIKCPYCEQKHYHGKYTAGQTEHRAAACDLYYPINRERRSVGYLFTVTERTQGES